MESQFFLIIQSRAIFFFLIFANNSGSVFNALFDWLSDFLKMLANLKFFSLRHTDMLYQSACRSFCTNFCYLGANIVLIDKKLNQIRNMSDRYQFKIPIYINWVRTVYAFYKTRTVTHQLYTCISV